MRNALRLSLAVALATAAACERQHDVQNAFVWTESLPAGATLHVRDGIGDITVRPARGSTVTVTADKHWRRGRERDITFQTQRAGTDVYVCAMWRGSGNCGERGYRGARMSGGILTMFSLFRHRSDATANFTVEVPASVRLDASTTVGDVDIQGAQGGLLAHSISGDVKASNIGGSVTLGTTNGDVQLGLVSMNGVDSVTLRSVNGDVEASLPGDLTGRVELSTVNGDIDSDFPIPTVAGRGRRVVQTMFGDNPRPIRLRTTNGDIGLKKRP